MSSTTTFLFGINNLTFSVFKIFSLSLINLPFFKILNYRFVFKKSWGNSFLLLRLFVLHSYLISKFYICVKKSEKSISVIFIFVLILAIVNFFFLPLGIVSYAYGKFIR